MMNPFKADFFKRILTLCWIGTLAATLSACPSSSKMEESLSSIVGPDTKLAGSINVKQFVQDKKLHAIIKELDKSFEDPTKVLEKEGISADDLNTVSFASNSFNHADQDYIALLSSSLGEDKIEQVVSKGLSKSPFSSEDTKHKLFHPGEKNGLVALGKGKSYASGSQNLEDGKAGKLSAELQKVQNAIDTGGLLWFVATLPEEIEEIAGPAAAMLDDKPSHAGLSLRFDGAFHVKAAVIIKNAKDEVKKVEARIEALKKAVPAAFSSLVDSLKISASGDLVSISIKVEKGHIDQLKMFAL